MFNLQTSQISVSRSSPLGRGRSLLSLVVQQASLNFSIAPDGRQNIGGLLDPFVGRPPHRLGSLSLGHGLRAALFELSTLLLQSFGIVGNHPHVPVSALN